MNNNLHHEWRTIAKSLRGRRKENQDNFLILKDSIGLMLKGQHAVQFRVRDWPDSHIRMAIADGMGGHMNGRQIAENAVRELANIPPRMTPEKMRDAIFQLHELLLNRFAKTRGGKNPGTTMIVADVEKFTGRTVLAGIGDSRAFLIRNQRWHRLTHDHLAFEFAFRDGDIGSEEYKKKLNSGSERLVQALGYGSINIIAEPNGFKPFKRIPQIRMDLVSDLPIGLKAHADVFSFKMIPGDTLLMATDGLWSPEKGPWPRVQPDEPDTEEGIVKMISDAIFQGSNDNITVLACHFQKTKVKAVE